MAEDVGAPTPGAGRAGGTGAAGYLGAGVSCKSHMEPLSCLSQGRDVTGWNIFSGSCAGSGGERSGVGWWWQEGVGGAILVRSRWREVWP